LYAPLRAKPKIACIHNPKIMQYCLSVPALFETSDGGHTFGPR
jgi:hypothetical protein